jgi:hypothetical protein
MTWEGNKRQAAMFVKGVGEVEGGHRNLLQNQQGMKMEIMDAQK